MALVHHHADQTAREENRCAAMFCLTWVGFFAVIALFSLLLSAL